MVGPKGECVGKTKHRFTKGRSCLTNMIFFYDEMTALVDEGRTVAIIYLDFSKAVSHNIFTGKLMGWMSRQSDVQLGPEVGRVVLQSLIGGQYPRG